MPRFAANLSMLFGEHAFLDRFTAASTAGFEGVEYLFPYAHPAEALREALERNGLRQVLHNLPAGNWDAGERGIACHPDRITEFQDGVATALTYARALECPRLNCLAGHVPGDVDPETAHRTLVRNLKFAAQELEKAGIDLLIEPINTRDVPGFFLHHTRQARNLIEEIGASNLHLQHDLYHMQVMEGDLARTLEANLDVIGHIQIADNPGRHEPGTGEINYAFLFDHLDRIGYDGWVGCEYTPSADTGTSLGWASACLGG